MMKKTRWAELKSCPLNKLKAACLLHLTFPTSLSDFKAAFIQTSAQVQAGVSVNY